MHWCMHVLHSCMVLGPCALCMMCCAVACGGVGWLGMGYGPAGSLLERPCLAYTFATGRAPTLPAAFCRQVAAPLEKMSNIVCCQTYCSLLSNTLATDGSATIHMSRDTAHPALPLSRLGTRSRGWQWRSRATSSTHPCFCFSFLQCLCPSATAPPPTRTCWLAPCAFVIMNFLMASGAHTLNPIGCTIVLHTNCTATKTVPALTNCIAAGTLCQLTAGQHLPSSSAIYCWALSC